MSRAMSASAVAPNRPAFDLIEWAARRKPSASPAAAARRSVVQHDGGLREEGLQQLGGEIGPHRVLQLGIGRGVEHRAGHGTALPRAGTASSAAISASTRMGLAM